MRHGNALEKLSQYKFSLEHDANVQIYVMALQATEVPI